MKICARNRFFPSVVMAGLSAVLVGDLSAQTFTTLHSFTDINPNTTGGWTNTDGAGPYAGLILSGDTLYGTAELGGVGGYGTVFATRINGAGFTNLHDFSGKDGALPHGSLVLAGNTLFGTTLSGGSSNGGTIFAVNIDGSGFTNIYNFDSRRHDPALPSGDLILSSNILYGTTGSGGGSSPVFGAIFAINTNSTGFTNLYAFNPGSGYNPQAGLVLSGNTLFGTTHDGGRFGYGTVFAIKTDGSGFTNLHSFNGFPDGSNPYAGLTLLGNTLYGATFHGGSYYVNDPYGNGTVFALNTDSTGFTNLYNFTRRTNSVINTDGANPFGTLFLSGDTLDGTTQDGGSFGHGTVFSINIDGTGFTTLHSFTGGSDGAGPEAGLTVSSNILYGTAIGGGDVDRGTVFSLFIPPQLKIIFVAGDIVLTWPTNYAGFDYAGYTLQSTTNLASPVWTTNLPAPGVVSDHNIVTNPISGTQQFFRLSQ